VAHCSEVIDFGRADIRDNCNEIGGITKITVVKEKLDSGLMPIPVDVIDTASVERGRTTNNSMNLVAKEEVGNEKYVYERTNAMTLGDITNINRSTRIEI